MLIWNSKRDFKSILLYVVCTVRCLFVPAIEKYAFECVFERFPKVAIEVGIDQWVQHWIKVTDPEQYRHQYIRALAIFAAQCSNYIPCRVHHM